MATLTKYNFDEKRHIHTFDGKPLMGVTTVLSVISKPSLIQWSANMACEYVLDNLKDIKDLESVVKEAKTAHRKKKEKAGDWGTEVHKAIEEWIKDKKEPELKQENQPKVFNLFRNWALENKVKFLESEKHLFSEKLWVGGICDMVFEIDGKKYIGDVKTSSGIYNEAFFQMGAYHLMLEEMGVDDIEGYIVINLKKDGTMDMKRADNMAINKQAFLSALELYKIINSLE